MTPDRFAGVCRTRRFAGACRTRRFAAIVPLPTRSRWSLQHGGIAMVHLARVVEFRSGLSEVYGIVNRPEQGWRNW